MIFRLAYFAQQIKVSSYGHSFKNYVQFEVERRTFHSYGYAHDPSAIDGSAEGNSIVGDKTSAEVS
jgi:hypothetical protein